MKTRPPVIQQVATASLLTLAASSTLAEEALYTPLAIKLATPVVSPLQGPGGNVQAGVGYTSDDNFKFGQYNGLYEKGAVFIGNARWRGWRGEGPQYWNFEAGDLGLETRRGVLQ